MFFYIGKDCPLQSLTQVQPDLYLDYGWSKIDGAFLKGYSTECDLNQSVDLILNGYQPKGIWCVIHNNKLYYPKHRCFPLYENGTNLTNVKLDNFNFVNCQLEIPSVTQTSYSLDEAALLIGDILLENTAGFLKYNDPENLHVVFTGGIDCTTSWAIIDTLTKNYSVEIYISNPREVKYSEYQSDLIDNVRQHWFYDVCRYKTKTNWLITGFYSERMQMREVTNGSAIFSYLKKDVFDVVTENDYLYWFLKRPSVNETFNFSNEKELKDWCYNSISSDYQGWHLDNNFHFSPFFDSRITDIMYNVSLDDIVINLRNAVIQRKILERFNPDLLKLVSDYKNSQRVYKNFRDNWSKVKLDPNVKVLIQEQSTV